jgi:hypothetical protein
MMNILKHYISELGIDHTLRDQVISLFRIISRSVSGYLQQSEARVYCFLPGGYTKFT